MIYAALKAEMAGSIHALSLTVMTPAEDPAP
jgi:acid stress-induced BolA-like protein IbaG/YrbA